VVLACCCPGLLLVVFTATVVAADEVDGANEVLVVLLALVVEVEFMLLPLASSNLSTNDAKSNCISLSSPLSLRASARSFQLRKFDMNLGGWKKDRNFDLNDDGDAADLTGLPLLADVSKFAVESAFVAAPTSWFALLAGWKWASWL
jgi:hypothetical protein